MQAAILDTIEREKNGFREPRIGEWYLTANPNLARDVAAGSLVLKSAYPELASLGFNASPGRITPITTSVPFSYNSAGNSMSFFLDANNAAFMTRHFDGNYYTHYVSTNLGVTSTYLNTQSLTFYGFAINPNTKTVLCIENFYSNVTYFLAPSYSSSGSVSFSTHGNVYGVQYYNNKFYVITSNGSSNTKIFASTTGTTGYATVYDSGVGTPGVSPYINHNGRDGRLLMFSGSDIIFPYVGGIAISSDDGSTWKRVNFPNPDSVIGTTGGSWVSAFNQNYAYPFLLNNYVYLNFPGYFVAISLDAIKNTSSNGTIPLSGIKFLRITPANSGYNNYNYTKYDPVTPTTFFRSDSLNNSSQGMSLLSWDAANSPALTVANQNTHISGLSSGLVIADRKLLYWATGTSFTISDYSAVSDFYALPNSILPTVNLGSLTINNPKPINYYLRYK